MRVLVAVTTAAGLAFAGATATASASPSLGYECPDLAKGLAGPCVAALQQALNANGADLAVDGIDGPLTDRATRDFQASHGLVVDGIAGPVTKAVLTLSASVPTPRLTTPAAPPAPTLPVPPGKSLYERITGGICGILGDAAGAAGWVVVDGVDTAKTMDPATAAAAAAAGRAAGAGATKWACNQLVEIPPAY
ncbi:peptidoglycan-binding domain-containing protein [Streptomyces sp. CBMA152]|uniref:peptidoglycan-binding domain-containing protein n=1 Tax=Streptomyces sp. CBMA152 TaxID=1896312 RepID=UPI002948B7BD|nr:peptidoglycan-binding domain-containing protein [Streptomyces sp. CBMA152]